jgi:hypothetical protein
MLLFSCSKEAVMSSKIKKINSFSEKEIYMGTLFGVGNVAEYMGVETLEQRLKAIGTNTSTYKVANQEYQQILDLLDEFLNGKSQTYLQDYKGEILSGDMIRIENKVVSSMDDFKEFCKTKFDLAINESAGINQVAGTYDIYDQNGDIDQSEVNLLASDLLNGNFVNSTEGEDPSTFLIGYIAIAVVVVAVAIALLFWIYIANPIDNDSRLKFEQLIATIATELDTSSSSSN